MGAAKWLLHPRRETRRAVRKAARNAAPHRVAFRLITGKRTVPTRRALQRRAVERVAAPFRPQVVATIKKGKSGKVTASKIKPLKPLNPLSSAHGKTSKTQRAKAAEQRRIDAVIRSTARRGTQAAQRARNRADSAADRAARLPAVPASASPMARNATQDPVTGRMTGSRPDRVPARNLPWTAASCEWCHGRGMRPLYTGNRVRSILGMVACTHVPVPPTPPGLEIQMPPLPGDRYVCASCSNRGQELISMTINGRTFKKRVNCHVCWGYIGAWNGAVAPKPRRELLRQGGDATKTPRVTMRQAQREYDKANRRANRLLGKPEGED